ncbi:addiction module protein [Oxalobacteraceae bacterium A2-2]
MAEQFERLAAEALALDPERREQLVQLLVASLEGHSDDDVLAAEVERRSADMESGATQGLALSEALDLIRARLK